MLLYIISLTACNEEGSLQAYAQEVPFSLAKDKVLKSYLADSKNYSPEKRLALHYKQLLSDWDYIPDPPGYDHFRNATNLIQSQQFKGDCEDFAIVMLSICHSLKLHCQIALGQNKNSGHVWAEVLISRASPDTATLNKIEHAFGSSIGKVQRESGYWLQFSPSGSLKKYSLTHTINTTGKLTKV